MVRNPIVKLKGYILIKSYHENSTYLPAIAAAVAGASVVVGSKT